METAIINKSIHHRKTKEIAEVVVNSLEAELFDLKDFNPYIMKGYDIIGLGSQLYWFKLHKKLTMFIEDLDKIENKKVFILSTSLCRKNLLDA
jgi:menaquinone-dependent protoporphyrinogen IX oxidase